MKTKFSENALTVLRERYLWTKKNGSMETPDQMFARVAKHVAGRSSKSLEKRFLKVLQDLAFLPNSPTLMNAGKKNAQLAACFVLPLKDDLGSIMDTLKATAMIHQSGGGTGFSFSNLRPAHSKVGSTRGAASGPLGFLALFNELTQTIKQGGLRRGANMGVLDASHPDIEAFIHCKQDTSKITNFNISVAASDLFFKAVKNDDKWFFKDPHTRKKSGHILARKLFEDLCLEAWKTGEPGLIFCDEINRQNPTPRLGIIEATNPCGEQPLLGYEACNLGSINLNSVFDPNSSHDQIQWNKLAELVETSVLFLDRVIDTCSYPIPEIHDLCHHNRKIGLGVMGFADLLIQMGISYGSQESFEVGSKIMKFIRDQAIQVSRNLAKKHGAFEGYSQSLWKKRGTGPLRNATLTTVAPTGTISLLANASAGIEPVFSYAYEKHVLDRKILWEVHPLFEKVLKFKNLDSEKILKEAAISGSLKNLKYFSPEEKRVFVTTTDITPEKHVRMQAAFQEFSDSAVSKTVNLHRDATVQDVKDAYLLAYDLKCKGITVYRDGSRPNQVLQLQACHDCRF